MIFYTLQGPSHSLEIHDDKILLLKKGWLRVFSRQLPLKSWGLHDLSQFNITVPQYILWGKVEWNSFDGTKGSFRFSTNPIMMKKIELYLQKQIIKNYQSKTEKTELPIKKHSKKSKRAA